MTECVGSDHADGENELEPTIRLNTRYLRHFTDVDEKVVALSECLARSFGIPIRVEIGELGVAVICQYVGLNSTAAWKLGEMCLKRVGLWPPHGNSA